jgi:diguanylate cyclase (GGDEF)-like protein
MFAAWGLSDFHVSTPLALALVSLLGYLIGRCRSNRRTEAGLRSRRELRRAHSVARELERIARTIRRNLSRHHASLAKFKQRVGNLSAQQQEAAWRELCREANEILTPTLRLTTQLATAYDQLRHQSNVLLSFSEVHTDPLTGVHNRRSLDEAIAAQLEIAARYDDPFSVILLDVDHCSDVPGWQGQLQGDLMLQEVARLLDEGVRETDVVGRYGAEQFLVVLPRADLEGACMVAERLRVRVGKVCPAALRAGVAAAQDGDTVEALLDRVGAALDQTKEAGRHRIGRSSGECPEPACEPELVG